MEHKKMTLTESSCMMMEVERTGPRKTWWDDDMKSLDLCRDNAQVWNKCTHSTNSAFITPLLMGISWSCDAEQQDMESKVFPHLLH